MIFGPSRFCHGHVAAWVQEHVQRYLHNIVHREAEKLNLKWTEAKWKTVLWPDESKFEILFENHGVRQVRISDGLEVH